MAPQSGAGEEAPAAATVEWTDRALADVAAIRAYLTASDPHAANRVAVALVAAGDSLETFPARGAPSPWFGARRVVVMRRYLLYYRIVGTRVEILSVRHGVRRPLEA